MKAAPSAGSSPPATSPTSEGPLDGGSSGPELWEHKTEKIGGFLLDESKSF
jgi:hypothetical protein